MWRRNDKELWFRVINLPTLTRKTIIRIVRNGDVIYPTASSQGTQYWSNAQGWSNTNGWYK